MNDDVKAFRRMLCRSYGLWPSLDNIAHRIHLRGPVGRYLCYRTDLAFGLTEKEARS